MMPSYYEGTIKELKEKLIQTNLPKSESRKKLKLVKLLEKSYDFDSKQKSDITIKIRRRWRAGIAEMKYSNFRKSISKALSQSADWSKSKHTLASNEFIKNEKEYLEAIGDDTYLRGWFYLNSKQKNKAIEVLKASFYKEYQVAIKVQRIHFSGCGGTPPFYWLEKYYESLKNLATGHDLEEIEKKYKDAQMHISNVPRSNIIT